MKIISREVNFGDTCQRISSSNTICTISTKEEKKISSVFEELKKNGKEVSFIDDLKVANEKVRVNELAKIRQLKKEQNGGFILISGVTLMGILFVGTVIFMTIKLLIVG